MTDQKTTLICDTGGTHARFACSNASGHMDHFYKYALNDFAAYEDIIQTYLDAYKPEAISAPISQAPAFLKWGYSIFTFCW